VWLFTEDIAKMDGEDILYRRPQEGIDFRGEQAAVNGRSHRQSKVLGRRGRNPILLEGGGRSLVVVKPGQTITEDEVKDCCKESLRR
jgi:hypothetical protein